MPHKIYFIICISLIGLKSLCQNTFVPDDNFEQTLIDLGYDTPPLNDYVPTANINTITDLDVIGKTILDLTGIEDFTALSNLDCSDNILSQLDVSQNLNLTELYCSDNVLTTIYLNNNTNLLRLWCNNNQLSNLDVTQNINLISLRCENNLLSTLNVDSNPNLNVLVCGTNQISSLNISNNLMLGILQCGNNFIENLNINLHTNLSHLSCEQNNISSLNLSNNIRLATLICTGNTISILDLSNNSDLTDLDASDNQLCVLHLNNGNNANMVSVDFSGNSDLNCVIVDNPNNSHNTWIPANFSNYADILEACSNFVPVDELEDVLSTSYTLPPLNNGNYFTDTNATGTALFPGDVINNSQTIYIYDETTCLSNETSFYVLITEADYYIPSYFTPNGDGSHDTWKIIDKNNSVNNITIYNRFGKLLKYLPADSNGWDGKFKGKQMPSDSYWYVVVLNTREVKKGYFALKR